jgi:hypothetical protein
MSELRTWLNQNSTLVYFLFAQAVALVGGGAWGLQYMVTLETRVAILETRGASYTISRLDKIDERLTVLEQQIKNNHTSIDRIVDVLTKELGRSPSTIPKP